MYAARPYHPPDMNRYAVMDLENLSRVAFGLSPPRTGAKGWAETEASTLNTASGQPGFTKPATIPLTMPTVAMGHIAHLTWNPATNRMDGGHHRGSLPGTLAVGGSNFNVVV